MIELTLMNFIFSSQIRNNLKEKDFNKLVFLLNKLLLKDNDDDGYDSSSSDD